MYCFFVLFLSLGKFYLNNKIKSAFIELSEKKISKISIYKLKYTDNEYVISNKEIIESILDFLIILEKDYYPYNDSLITSAGLTHYHLIFEDKQSPTHLRFHGNEYITLDLYDYSKNEYKTYRAKIEVDEDEIHQLLSGEK